MKGSRRILIAPKREIPTASEIKMPSAMVRAFQNVSKIFKNAVIAIRGNSSQPLYSEPSAPKPGIVKAKTSNQGFCEGMIPVDDKKLGKIDPKTGVIREYTEKDLPHKANGEVDLPTIQHKQSLKHIMDGLKSGRYEYVDEQKTAKNGILRVREVANKNFNPVIYSIDLKDAKATAPTQKIKLGEDAKVATSLPPKWWNEAAFGKFEEKIDYRYPTFYQVGDTVKPLSVYGRRVGNDVLPITGDQDILWISIPADLTLPSELKAHEVINVFAKDVDNGTVLIERLLDLSDHFANEKKDDSLRLKIEDIPNSIVAGMGITTAYESYMAILINREIKLTMGIDLDYAYIRNFIQHGFENRTPFKPESLDGIIHHIGANFHLVTRTESELINLVAKRPEYEKQLIDVHPQWKPEWAPVVERQKNLRETHGLKPLATDVADKFTAPPTAEKPRMGIR